LPRTTRRAKAIGYPTRPGFRAEFGVVHSASGQLVVAIDLLEPFPDGSKAFLSERGRHLRAEELECDRRRNVPSTVVNPWNWTILVELSVFPADLGDRSRVERP
jgi:hypothetical protein